jgi:hypothetical protein
LVTPNESTATRCLKGYQTGSFSQIQFENDVSLKLPREFDYSGSELDGPRISTIASRRQRRHHAANLRVAARVQADGDNRRIDLVPLHRSFDFACLNFAGKPRETQVN